MLTVCQEQISMNLDLGQRQAYPFIHIIDAIDINGFLLRDINAVLLQIKYVTRYGVS